MHPSINRTHKYNKGSVMKRALVPLIMILLMLMFTFVSSAKEYEFELNDKDLSIDDDLSVFFDSLPDDIKNRIEPIDEMNSAEISQKYSFKDWHKNGVGSHAILYFKWIIVARFT